MMLRLGKGAQRYCLICAFVLIGIFVFALLHALINVVASSKNLSENGNWNFYSQNLTSCRVGSFSAQPSSFWFSTLVHLHSISSLHKKLDDTENSIRLASRAVYEVNQTLSSPYPSLHAGECVKLMDSYSYLKPFKKQKVSCFPSFMIVGAMKCGTGELMKWLELHPYLRVIAGNGKKRESHFFTHNLPEDLRKQPNKNDIVRAYSQQLPLLSFDEAATVYTFEKSPDYLRNDKALSLIKSVLPNIRLVIILRNPIHRVLSEFNHHCRHRRYVKLLEKVDIPSIGRTPAKSFPRGSILRIIDSTVHSEVSQPLQIPKSSTTTRSTQDPSHISRKNFFIVELKDLPIKSYMRLRQPCSVDDMVTYLQQTTELLSLAPQHTTNNRSTGMIPEGERSSGGYLTEIENGFYDVQLENLFKIFSPSQVHILLQEDMYRNTYRSLHRVEEFLGLPCYDYSQVAYTPNANAPPVRKARTIGGKIQETFSYFLTILFGAYSSSSITGEHTSSTVRSVQSGESSHINGPTKSPTPSSHGEKLFKQTPKSFQTWLISVYAGHNRNLINVLSKNYGWTTVSNDNTTSKIPATTYRQPFLDIARAWNLK